MNIASSDDTYIIHDCSCVTVSVFVYCVPVKLCSIYIYQGNTYTSRLGRGNNIYNYIVWHENAPATVTVCNTPLECWVHPSYVLAISCHIKQILDCV